MTTAFQSSAFQTSAFQIDPAVTPSVAGGIAHHRARPKPRPRTIPDQRPIVFIRGKLRLKEDADECMACGSVAESDAQFQARNNEVSISLAQAF